MHRFVLALTLVMLAGTAAARPPPQIAEDVPARPMLEWSTWVRLGYGTEAVTSTIAARATEPIARTRATTWEVALGADATLPISSSGDVRVGPWVELRDERVVAGGELVIGGVPAKLDLFHYRGAGIVSLRVGGTPEVGTASLAYGYSAPWKLWGPWRGAARYMIGVRFVGTVTRAHDDPGDWSATMGIEVEPIGALRYLLGIRSLY